MTSHADAEKKETVFNLDKLDAAIQIEGLDPNLSSSTRHKLEYWKWTICAVLLPFTLIGFPTHLMFGELRDSSLFFPRNMTTSKWLRIVFDLRKQSAWMVCLTTITFTISGTLLAFVVYDISKIFYQVLILGTISDELPESLLNLFRSVPALFPIVLGWFKGYQARHLINSLDLTRLELKGQICTEKPGEPTGVFGRKRETRTTLIFVYVAILSAHTAHAIAEREGNSPGLWVNHVIDAMHSLVLPVYFTFCWVISSELEILSRQLEVLQLTAADPSHQLFLKIKICYKKIAAHIHEVNDVLSLFLGWVFLLTLISIIAKIVLASLYLFGAGALKEFLTSCLEIIGLGHYNERENEDGPTSEPYSDEGIKDAAVVRSAFAYFYASAVQLGLIFYTIAQATNVNDQARFLHVILNDYGTEVARKMSAEVYQAFRLLKNFMHSTNEQSRPALLSLPISIVFSLKNNVQEYNLRS